jgi:hypothetical protein
MAPIRAGEVSEPHLIVVSYLANVPFSARGIRTRELLKALRRECSVELIARPANASRLSGQPHVRRTMVRKALHYAHSSFLLDRFEVWSWRRFRSWRPNATGGLLVGFPFSPLVYASRRLAAEGIPYVVDIGDPWVLTIAGGRSATRHLGRMRARMAEHRMWSGAAGAVVTTDSQSVALQALFPKLPILVRPNGFPPVSQSKPLARASLRPRGPHSILRLVHFGDIYVARLKFEPVLERLARSGMWERIEFHQYGSDWTGALIAHGDVEVVFHEPRPWSDIVEIAPEYDLAVVIGNRDPTTLPSKAVEYLQLPIPRLAVVADDRNDAVTQYVADKPGWIVIRADTDDDVAPMVQRHVLRTWTAAELAAPATERWDRVSDEIIRFVLRVLTADASQRT